MYFSDFFAVSPEILDKYGALNISLVNDLPLFIDPFLLFNSEKAEYQDLHAGIIDYLVFLRDQSITRTIDAGLLESWYCFHEVKQNWLGFSSVGNRGSGLGIDFANTLNASLGAIFKSFGKEQITKGSHLEKLCLIKNGIGRDNISDFVTNLIKGYLLQYTQVFAREHIDPSKVREFTIPKAVFNRPTLSWASRQYALPSFGGDYVILTPKDMLTRDENWIARPDMIDRFQDVCISMPDEALRSQLNAYLQSVLPTKPKRDDYLIAIDKTIQRFPEFIEHYIRSKEDEGDQATSISENKVKVSEEIFIRQVRPFIEWLHHETEFYKKKKTTFEESLDRVLYLKQVIENNDGYRVFYLNGKPVGAEKDLQLIFRLTWFETVYDVNSEVNNGRGPVDYKVSFGRKDSTLIEFKLASNSQLKRNLEKQIEIYGLANRTDQFIKVIMYFTEEEYGRVYGILVDLGLSGNQNIVLIDARADNKPSASKA
jgi:hypothetical protein